MFHIFLALIFLIKLSAKPIFSAPMFHYGFAEKFFKQKRPECPFKLVLSLYSVWCSFEFQFTYRLYYFQIMIRSFSSNIIVHRK